MVRVRRLHRHQGGPGGGGKRRSLRTLLQVCIVGKLLSRVHYETELVATVSQEEQQPDGADPRDGLAAVGARQKQPQSRPLLRREAVDQQVLQFRRAR